LSYGRPQTAHTAVKIKVKDLALIFRSVFNPENLQYNMQVFNVQSKKA